VPSSQGGSGSGDWVAQAEVPAVLDRCHRPAVAGQGGPGVGGEDGPVWGSVAADSVADAADCSAGEEQQGDGYGAEYDGGDPSEQDVA